MTLEKTIASISRKMKEDYEDLSSQLEHAGLKGEEREEIVREFLNKYIHGRFGVTKGEILATNGDISKQQDIIIYDFASCPSLYNERNIQILPVEGVYCVIEVKSKIDEEELKKSIKNISSVKKLPKKAFVMEKSVIKSVITELGEKKPYFNTLGILFAFSSGLTLDTIRTKLLENYKFFNIPPKEQIDFIFILNRGLIVQYDMKNNQISVTVEHNCDLGIIETDDGLLLFYLLLIERLGLVSTPPIKIKDYASFLYKIKV